MFLVFCSRGNNGILSSFIVWQNLPDESELHLIATAPECRRRGVASALL
ncbi:ribosomal-protein-alanine N-acetyltransferase, partial [Neisseria meningitidis]